MSANRMGLTPEQASAACLSCGNCCKSLILYHPRPPFAFEPECEEFFRVRGIRVLAKERGWYRVMVPMPCPHLASEAPWKCDIYETRPENCRRADGSEMPTAECAWNV